jgi:hypothetical protein
MRYSPDINSPQITFNFEIGFRNFGPDHSFQDVFNQGPQFSIASWSTLVNSPARVDGLLLDPSGPHRMGLSSTLVPSTCAVFNALGLAQTPISRVKD